MLLEEPLAGRIFGGHVVSVVCRSGHGAVANCCRSYAPVHDARRCDIGRARGASAHDPVYSLDGLQCRAGVSDGRRRHADGTDREQSDEDQGARGCSHVSNLGGAMELDEVCSRAGGTRSEGQSRTASRVVRGSADVC